MLLMNILGWLDDGLTYAGGGGAGGGEAGAGGFSEYEGDPEIIQMMVGNWEKVILICEKIVADKNAFGWESQESWMQAHFYLFKAYNENGDLEKANAMGMQILDIWNEADEDLPRLLELKSSLKQATSSS